MSIRVLLADDHAVVRDGLKVLLQQGGGIQVVGEAADGRAALRLAMELQPDVVVMDIAMRELNGIEATQTLRDKCPDIRVIMLSMHSDSEHVFRAIQAGAVGFILKESAGEEVAAAVRAAYAGGSHFSGAISALVPGALARAGRPSPLASLSARERQVLQLVVEGHSSAEIGARIHLSPKTVETYRVRLMHKLGVNDLPGLVKFAVAHGLTPAG
jgi:DNA-binding NarL/FixJ family response regulator